MQPLKNFLETLNQIPEIQNGNFDIKAELVLIGNSSVAIELVIQHKSATAYTDPLRVFFSENSEGSTNITIHTGRNSFDSDHNGYLNELEAHIELTLLTKAIMLSEDTKQACKLVVDAEKAKSKEHYNTAKAELSKTHQVMDEQEAKAIVEEMMNLVRDTHAEKPQGRFTQETAVSFTVDTIWDSGKITSDTYEIRMNQKISFMLNRNRSNKEDFISCMTGNWIKRENRHSLRMA